MPNERIVPVLVRRMKNDDSDLSAATTDVLYNDSGGAHHRTRGSGVLEHKKAHTTDAATIVRLNVDKGDQILWVGDERLELVEFEFLGPPTATGGHPGHHAPTPAVTRSANTNPFESTSLPLSGPLQDRIIASGPPNKDAPLGFYKATFRVGGKVIDPDFEICRNC